MQAKDTAAKVQANASLAPPGNDQQATNQQLLAFIKQEKTTMLLLDEIAKQVF